MPLILAQLDLWHKAIRGIGAILCNFIYSLISLLYQLFMTVSRLNILSSDTIAPIYQRVTMILTIVMTFYITFEFVKYILEPDKMTDKEKGVGNILTRMVVVVVLIAFVPQMFTLAYKAQNIIIENQVFSKVILGKKSVDYNTIGNDFSANVLSQFYGIDEEVCGTSGCSEEKEIVASNITNLRNGDSFNIAKGINKGEKNGDEVEPTIKFNGFMAVIVGGFLLYILVLYSIDVGTRYAQLLFLQIIAPISIIGYILPKKDGIFQKWYKQCFTTYLDLFIRIGLIYFVLLIIKILGDAFNTDAMFNGIDGVTPAIKALTYIALVMGLLMFAQRAPKLLGELFPSSGAAGLGFGLKAADRVAPGAARAIGASLGGTTGMIRRGIARGRAEHNRRNDIREKRLAEGKAIDRKSMRKELAADRAKARTTNSELKGKRNDLANATEDLNKAEQALAEAKKSGNQNAINTAEANHEAAKNRFKKAKEAYDKAKRNDLDAQSALASSRNQNYGANIGVQVAGAALGGAVTGIKTGGSATKLEEITKKGWTETGKNIKEAEIGRTDWLEAGGSATVTGTIDKTVAKFDKSIGIKTQAERIKQEVKVMEAKAKALEAQASMEKTVKTYHDSAKERSMSKISKHEQKIEIRPQDRGGLTIKVNGHDEAIKILPNEKTTSDVHMRYEAEANTAKAKAEAANAELIKAEMAGRATQSMRDTAQRLANEATMAKYKEEQVLKVLGEYGVTRSFDEKDPIPANQRDGILDSQVAAARAAIDNARHSQDAVDAVREAFNKRFGENSSKTQKYFDAFMNGENIDWDILDSIEASLTSHSSKLTSDSSAIKEQVRVIQESSATDAANANDAAVGGKK